MNKFTRLTALLLAMLMIFSTVASAETAYKVEDMTVEQWNALVENVESIVGTPTIDEGGVAVRPEIPDQPIIGAYPDGQQYLVTTEADLSEGSVSAKLYTSGQLILEGAEAGQWQININGVWVNITGEVESTLTVTNAMVQDLGETIQVRQVNAPEKIADITIMEYNATMMLVAAVRAAQTVAEDETSPTAADDVLTIEEANQFLVTINYVFEGEDNKPAASSYNAVLGLGTPFNHSQPNPSVQGYQVKKVEISDSTVASYDAENNAINFAIASVQHNVVVKVIYEPAMVDYTIIKYYQNPVGNGYTVNTTNTVKQGLTGSEVPAENIAEPPTGFYALLYDRPAIAADGSTVVEIYYDRYYYLLSFELDGGYGVEPVYARYGSDLPEIGTPTKPGYTFEGWASSKTLADAGTVDVQQLPPTMPAAHTTYYAVWEMDAEAKVNIVFWGENPNDEGYSYIQTGEVMADSGSSFTYTHGTPVYMLCDLEEHEHGVDCTLTCGKEEHTTHTNACFQCTDNHVHTLDCYRTGSYNYYELTETTKPSQLSVPSQDGVLTYTTGSGNNKETHYYLYLDGKWYCAEGNWLGGGDTTSISLDCDYTHTHTDACYKCEYHAHTDACYNCGEEEHIHDNNCNQEIAGLDATLWQFVRSETATVNPDGSTTINVYYDRTEFTLHFRKKNSNQDDYGTIKAKWGSNIEDEFDAVCELAGYQSWSENRDASSPWTNYIAIMPKKDMTYYSYTGSGNNQWVMTYYKETFVKGEYEVAFTVTLYRSNSTTVSKEEFLELEGFTFNEDKSTKTGSSTNGAKFYYDRNTYNIEFYNPNELIKKVTGIHYQASIADQGFTPGAEWIPEQYEPGSVEFAGWYLNPECTGEQYTFEGKTMPVAPNNGDTSLVLYAKWTEKTYTVRFFLTEADLAAGNVYDPADKVVDGMPMVLSEAKFEGVPHGTILDENYVINALDRDAMIAANPRDPYTFVVWYYYDEAGNKQVFTPSMQIKGNLDLIAEWTSDVLIPYTIKYATYTLDDAGNKVVDKYIADPTTGSKLAGEQLTFDAKGGTELYADYQTGYFPETTSHTITFQIPSDGSEVTTQEWIFWYTHVDAVPYEVHYKIVDENGNVVGPAITNADGTEYIKQVTNNDKAVVTENFEVVTDYMPDAYQKRLVVTPEGPNVITFYYTKDTKHAYYQVTHYTQNIDGTRLEHRSSQIQGLIGTTQYADDQLSLAGFTFSKIEYVYDDGTTPVTTEGSPDDKHTLDAYGLQINLYYIRNSYPYVVNYFLENSTTKLIDSKDGNGLYGDTVDETAVNIPGYDALEPTTKTHTILIEDTDTPKLNVINFYYREKVATINYVPVTSDGGQVSLNSESIGVLNGTVTGSTPTANTNYKFVGWYTDASCTVPVDESWVDKATNKLTPQKTKDYDDGEDKKIGYESATFYALFELDVADLTIKKVVEPSADGTAAPAGEVFTLEVDLPNGSYPYSNSNGTTGTLKVVDGKGTLAIKADETITITGIVIGSAYKVTEIKVPTYFKASEAVSGTIAASGNTATITNTYLTGSLTVKKEVVDATAPDDAFTFTVQYGDKTETFTLKKNGVKTITGIPAGTAYTVTEEANSKYTTTKTGDTGTIASGETAKAVFTNTYMYGDLKIGKRVEPEESADKKQTFEFTLELSDTETAYQYIITDDKNVQQSTGTIKSGGTFQLQDEWHILVKDLPGDTTYTVTETQIPGYATYVSVDNVVDGATGNTHISTGTIEAGEERVTRFVNVYGLGAINIIKDVVGTDAPDDTFYFTLEVKDSNGNPLDGIFSLLTTYEDEKGAQVTKTDNVNVGAPIDFTLNAGWSALISGLPEGTQYTIAETEHADYDTWVKTKEVETAADETSYGDKTYVATGMIPAKGMKQVIYTNVYQYSHLTIRKEGMEAGESAIFQVTAYSKYNKDQQTTFTVSVPNGKSVTIGELLIGSDYTITEVGSWSNRYPQATTETGTIQQNGSEVTITNTGKNQQWLHGEDYVHNDFSKPGAYGN